MTRLRILTVCFCLFTLFTNAQILITGNVLDTQTKDPLPFASIAVPNSTTGTMTNAKGKFELQLKEGQTEIQVSYVGYIDTLITINGDITNYPITLDPYTFGLTEIIVTSLTPLEYIQKALEKHPSLIPQEPFTARSFYASKSSLNNDDNNSYELNQAVYKTYFSDYSNDTLNEASQLLLHKTVTEGEFESILSKNKKMQKFADKEQQHQGQQQEQEQGQGQEKQNSISISSNEGISININDVTGAGPDGALKETKTITQLPFFDNEYFKKFRYSFGEQTFYKGRELIRIDFYNKRKVEFAFYKGSIFLDYQDLAIVAIDYNLKAKIPFYVNALIKTFGGFTLYEITNDVKIRNQYLDYWYPKELVFDLDITLKQKGELEVYSIAQVLHVEELIIDNPQPIDENKVFDQDKDFEEQIFTQEGLEWKDINIIKIEDN